MSYHHVNAQERVAIFYLRQMRWSFRAIGRRLGRHHTTIAREFRRNAPRYSGYSGTARLKPWQSAGVPCHGVIPPFLTQVKSGAKRPYPISAWA